MNQAKASEIVTILSRLGHIQIGSIGYISIRFHKEQIHAPTTRLHVNLKCFFGLCPSCFEVLGHLRGIPKCSTALTRHGHIVLVPLNRCAAVDNICRRLLQDYVFRFDSYCLLYISDCDLHVQMHDIRLWMSEFRFEITFRFPMSDLSDFRFQMLDRRLQTYLDFQTYESAPLA